MFSEVLKIIPRLDTNSLNNMERTLGQRFSRVAKAFGKGVRLSLLAAVGTQIVNKILNPLNEVKAAIDRTLKSADDIVTNAQQFGTTPEKLLKLQSLGELKGLDKETLYMLLSKYQTALAEAAIDPNLASPVREFANDKDIASSFFEFIQQLKGMDDQNRTNIQKQIFGEKSILKVAEFMGSDFASGLNDLSKVDFDKIGEAVRNLEKQEGEDRRLKVINELNDIIDKSKVITGGVVSAKALSDQELLKRENARIGRFEAAKNMETKVNNISDNIEKLLLEVVNGIPIITTALNTVVDLLRLSAKGWAEIAKLLKDSRLLKGLLKWVGN